MNAMEQAEHRLNIARREVHSGLSRAQARLRENLVHPITLVSVVGGGALLSCWAFSRPRHTVVAAQPRSSSPWPALLTLAMRVLPFVLWRARLAQMEQGE